MEKKLILLAEFDRQWIAETLIPEIEHNCAQHGIFSQAAYESYRSNQFAADSLYFCHDFASYEIPMGEEYGAVAVIDENWKIPPWSIVGCRSKVLCFFSSFRSQPQESGWRGYRGICQVWFEGGVPSIIRDTLLEFAEYKRRAVGQREIILCEESELHRLSRKPGKFYEQEH